MRSRAAIGNHPLHPALVALPIGAFFLVLVADLAYLNSHRAFWAEMSGVALAVGVIGALIAAVPGLIDYSALPAGSRLRATATAHMVIMLTVVTLDAASLYLRSHSEGTPFQPSTSALALSFLAFALLGAAGWLGGKMVFELRAGVVEPEESRRERS